MPLDQPFAGTERAPRRSERPVTGTADSGRQFVRARRHTWIVRTLRFILPIVTVGVIGLYVASAMSSLDLVSKLAQLPIPTISPENVTMDNPRYEGFSKDGGSYVVRARTARQDFKQTELVQLNEISGELVDARKITTEMTAASGVFHTKTNVLSLLGGIQISSTDGMAGELTSATIFAKRGVILSKERSTLKVSQGEISSDQLMIWQKKRKVTFVGNVKTRLTPPPAEPSADASKDADQAGEENVSTRLIGTSDGPVDIASNILRVEDLNNTASFIGQVQAVQGDQALHSERLDVFYENQDGGTDGQSGIPGSGSGRVTRMVSSTPIIITRGDTERITAESLDVDPVNEIAVLAGNVEMASGLLRSARSDLAEIDARNDTALLTGDVVVTQGTNEIRGGRLLINRKLGTSQLTSPATLEQAAGRIFAKLKRDGSAANGKAASSQDGKDTIQGMTVGTFKTDPDAPVDVEADELAISELQKTVEFHGDVRASQGGFSIRTTKLIAHYSGGAGLLDPAAQDKETSGGSSSGTQLTRMSAREKVLVSSAGGQSATGDWADFDVAGNTVTLGGDVVITQGKNIVRGTRLKIDMTSGNSMIETAPEAAGAGWASTMQPDGGSTRPVAAPGGAAARGGRPSAVFYPTQFKQKNGDGKSGQSKSNGGGASANSWGATTAPD